MKSNKLIPNFIAKFLLFPIATSCFCYSCVSAMDKCSDNCGVEIDRLLRYFIKQVVKYVINPTNPEAAKKDSIDASKLLSAVQKNQDHCNMLKKMIIDFIDTLIEDNINIEKFVRDARNAKQLLESDKDNTLLKKYVKRSILELPFNINCDPEVNKYTNSSSDIKKNTQKYKDALEYATDKVISRVINPSQPMLAKKDSIAGGNLLLAVHASKEQCLKFKKMIINFLNDSTNLLGTEYDNSHFQNAIQLLRSDKDNLLLKKYISDLFIEQ